MRSLWSLLFNTTTIESWEIERHGTLVRRARTLGGHLEGPGGVKVRIKRQEFPYDIGLFSNIRQGMGGSINVRIHTFSIASARVDVSQIFGWLWPLSFTPDRRGGWEFETNGFEGLLA